MRGNDPVQGADGNMELCGPLGQPVGWVASFGPNAPRVLNSALPIRSFDRPRQK